MGKKNKKIQKQPAFHAFHPSKINPSQALTPSQKRKFRNFALCILLVGLILKLYHLGHPKNYCFDEIYHAFTAIEYHHHNPKVFDPWAKPPEGVAYEWTHPPLSKILMSGFIALFGENSFGWRLGSTVFGTGAILLSGIFALELGESLYVALATLFFLTFEGLTFVQSRIGMNDAFFIFFMLLTLISYVRWRKDTKQNLYIILTGIFLGLSLATKWTGLYLFGILGIDLIACFIMTNQFPGNQFPFKEAIAWTTLPALTYLASYLPFFLGGGKWDAFVELQKQMWYYHRGLTQTHPYGSKPWQWIFNLRPVWIYVDYSQPGKVGNIYNIGNSIILLPGLFAVYWALFKEKIQIKWETKFLALCYFMLWVPWTFSPRVMLFYHYLPAVPFLCLFLAKWVEHLIKDPQIHNQRLGKGIILGSVIWFLIFYPHMTGIPIDPRIANAIYFLVPGWK